MSLTFILNDINNLPDTVREIMQKCTESKTFILIGNLGAGKTTFIQEYCRQLGCKDEVTSPTFSIINEYQIPHDLVYHMDLYRLKDINEATEIGIEEYLYNGKYCFIEWPDIIREYLDFAHYEVKINTTEDQGRKIEVTFIS